MSRRAELLAALNRGGLVGDGAMGTELFRAGHPFSACYEALSETSPETVLAIHRGYVRAGARLLRTNTFGANPVRLALSGRAADLERLVTASVALARDAAADRCWVVGSVGPLGLTQAAAARPDTVRDHYRRAVLALATAGVDALQLETFSALDELLLALDAAASEAPQVPVIACMTFTPEGDTSAGDSADEVALALEERRLVALGANCSAGPDSVSTAITRMRRVTQRPLVAYPNAGLPERRETGVVWPLGPIGFERTVRGLWKGGAALVGGCCGAGPEHIMALTRGLGHREP